MTARYRLRTGEELQRYLRHLPPPLKQKIRAALDALLEYPASGKPLRAELTGLWSYRVGRFRIIYRIGERRIIDLVTVGPRAQVYERARLLARPRRLV